MLRKPDYPTTNACYLRELIDNQIFEGAPEIDDDSCGDLNFFEIVSCGLLGFLPI